MLIEKNNLLSQELEKCQTRLVAVTAELEKSKKATPGNIPFHLEKCNHIPVMLILLYFPWKDR